MTKFFTPRKSFIPKIELCDWSERFPKEDSRTIAIRQSTYCCCGARDCRKSKEIGKMTCKGGTQTIRLRYRATEQANE